MASRRNIYLSTQMNMKDLYNLISQLKFHSSEYKEFLTSKTNFELYAKSEDENISKKEYVPIFFMNYKSENEKDLKRGNLPNSFKINPHVGKNKQIMKGMINEHTIYFLAIGLFIMIF